MQRDGNAIRLSTLPDRAAAGVVEQRDGIRTGVELDVDVADTVPCRPFDAVFQAGAGGKCKTPLPTRTRTPTATRTASTTATRTPTAPASPTHTASPSRTATPQCFAELCVTKFNDLDGDGTPDAGEPGLAGWTINVVDAGMHVVPVVTGAQGTTCTGVPAPAVYTAFEVPQGAWTQTYPPPPGTHVFGIECGQLVNIAFGNMQIGVPTPTRTATATATRTATRTSNIPPID